VPKIMVEAGRVEYFDTPAMREMSDDEYRGAVAGLLYLDHHGVLRSRVADFPIAATPAQLDIFTEELEKLRRKMAPERGIHLAAADGADETAA
jgi:hypothetical protein